MSQKMIDTKITTQLCNFMNIRRRLLMLFIMLPVLSACRHLPTPPIIMPFEVQKAGTKIESYFRIEKSDTYSFTLRVGFKKGDFERVARLAGHFKYSDGIPIPLRIRVAQIDTTGEKTILDKEVSELQYAGISVDRFHGIIINFKMSPGDYRVYIESLKDISALQGTQIEFAIERAYLGK